jgi:hypothetical protein
VDSDACPKAFFLRCNHLLKEAVVAAGEGRQASAAQLFLRVACLYRLSRLCSTSCSFRWKAFEAQKAAYALGTSSWTDPVCEVFVPHTRRENDDGYEIPVYIRLPTTHHQAPIPTTILLTAADGCRADYSWALHECLRKGWGCVILESPGSGDSPADPTDPQSLSRLWESLTTWMEKQGAFDTGSLCAWWPQGKGHASFQPSCHQDPPHQTMNHT